MLYMVIGIGFVFAVILGTYFETARKADRERKLVSYNRDAVDKRDRERRRQFEMRQRRKKAHFRSLGDAYLPVGVKPVDGCVCDACNPEPVVTINPEPTDLELEMVVGPAANIKANEKLIRDIERLWQAHQAAEREASYKTWDAEDWATPGETVERQEPLRVKRAPKIATTRGYSREAAIARSEARSRELGRRAPKLAPALLRQFVKAGIITTEELRNWDL